MKKITTFVVLAAAVPVLAFAQANTPRIDQRQANQEQRIDQGVASGSLTQRETNRLERGQQHVENIETRAKSDGVVSKRERARLLQAENVQSRHISAQRHDRQHDYNHNGVVDHPRRR